MIKKLPISVQRRIDEINALLPQVLECDNYASSYGGSTHCSYVELSKAIEVKNQFVYIFEEENRYKYGFEKRYNTNDRDYFSHNGLKSLKHDLNIIKKAFTKLINQN